MISKSISISQLAVIKQIAIEELYQLAKEKGVVLPNDPNYIMSSSELMSIDPKLAWDIKYGKVLSSKSTSTDSGSQEIIDVVPPEVFQLSSEKKPAPKVNVLGKIDLSTLNQSIRPKQKSKDNKESADSEKNQKPPKRIIGIVKFFDSMKGWGFVISGSKGISGKPEDEGKLFSLHITSSEWHGATSPNDGEWIFLTPRKTSRGWSAINAERIEYNRDTLLFAMKYRGKYAKICGSDSKGDRYDENILCHIINKMTLSSRAVFRYSYSSPTYDTSKFAEIIDSFCEYIADMPVDRQSSIVKQFLEDKGLNNLLFKIFTEGDYSSDNSSYLAAYRFYNNLLFDHVFESGKLDALAKLPESFDFVPYIDKLVSILVGESKSNSNAVEKWLSDHHVLNNLKLNNRDANTIPLRLIIRKLSNDSSWIDDLQADWNDIRNFIKDNISHAYQYCKYYFAGKDETFIRGHAIIDLLDDVTISNWCKDLMSEDKSLTELLRLLMENKVNGNLDLWGKYVNKGFNIAPSYPILRAGLSTEIKDNAEGVRAFLNTCNQRGITIVDIFGNEEGLSDELYAELFVDSGDFEYLNRMDDFDSISSWVSKQQDSFIATFIKRYGPLIEDDAENDTFISSLGDEAVVKALKTLPDDEQFQLLRYFPKDYATDIVSGHFSDTTGYIIHSASQ